jgi:ankyrin repeat protein
MDSSAKIQYSVDLDSFVCPITQKLFLDPVLASSGVLYERDAIEKWLTEKDTCPTTRIKISKEVTSCLSIKNMVDTIISIHPELKKDRYDGINDDKVIEIVRSGSYSKLPSVSKFNLQPLIDHKLMQMILEKCPSDIIKHVIDRSNDLECKNSKGWYIINYFLRYSTSLDLIKQIIDKGVSLEHSDNEKWRPIHYACRYQKFDVIGYLINRGVDLEAEDNEKWRPIHYVCRFQATDFNLIKVIIDKGVNLEVETDGGQRPLDILCRHSTMEAVKFIIDRGVIINHPTNRTSLIQSVYQNELITDKIELIRYIVDRMPNIEAVDYSGRTVLQQICEFSVFYMIKYLIEKGAKVNCPPDIKGWQPIHSVCRFQSIEAIIYLIQNGADLNAPPNSDGWQPFHIICRYQKTDAIEYAIKKDVDTKSKIKKYDGKDVEYDCWDLIKKNNKIGTK